MHLVQVDIGILHIVKLGNIHVVVTLSSIIMAWDNIVCIVQVVSVLFIFFTELSQLCDVNYVGLNFQVCDTSYKPMISARSLSSVCVRTMANKLAVCCER